MRGAGKVRRACRRRVCHRDRRRSLRPLQRPFLRKWRHKVVEMLRSEHLRGASRELRRAAVLMALDAAGVTADEVLQDAKVRQEAIDAYATEQRKHAEMQWSRKAEENIQIQAELELVKAH